MMIVTAASLSKMLALGTALSAAMVGTWEATDWLGVRPVYKREFVALQQQAEDMSQSLILIRFQLLQDRWKHGGLSPEDQQMMCRYAMALGYNLNLVDGCH